MKDPRSYCKGSGGQDLSQELSPTSNVHTNKELRTASTTLSSLNALLLLHQIEKYAPSISMLDFDVLEASLQQCVWLLLPQTKSKMV